MKIKKGNEKEENEIRVAQEYLRFRKIEFYDIESLSQFCPKHANLGISGPDVKVCITDGWHNRSVGIELTEYNFDAAGGGGSPGSQLADFRKKLSDYIMDQHLPKDARLGHCIVNAEFKKAVQRGNSDIAPLGDEMVSFLIPRLEGIKSDDSFYDFDGFPALKKQVSTLKVFRCGSVEIRNWFTSNANNFPAIKPAVIIERINSKAQKKMNYDSTQIDELWLLIYAYGSGRPSSVTAHKKAVQPYLCSEDVIQASRVSSFDRIIFWERVLEWDHEIWRGTKSSSRLAC